MANVNMYQCNTGYKFEHNGQLHVRYSTKKAVLMSDDVRLEQHKRIKRRTENKAQKIRDTSGVQREQKSSLYLVGTPDSLRCVLS